MRGLRDGEGAPTILRPEVQRLPPARLLFCGEKRPRQVKREAGLREKLLST